MKYKDLAKMAAKRFETESYEWFDIGEIYESMVSNLVNQRMDGAKCANKRLFLPRENFKTTAYSSVIPITRQMIEDDAYRKYMPKDVTFDTGLTMNDCKEANGCAAGLNYEDRVIRSQIPVDHMRNLNDEDREFQEEMNRNVTQAYARKNLAEVTENLVRTFMQSYEYLTVTDRRALAKTLKRVIDA